VNRKSAELGHSKATSLDDPSGLDALLVLSDGVGKSCDKNPEMIVDPR